MAKLCAETSCTFGVFYTKNHLNIMTQYLFMCSMRRRIILKCGWKLKMTEVRSQMGDLAYISVMEDLDPIFIDDLLKTENNIQIFKEII